jgi:hypothetical protein
MFEVRYTCGAIAFFAVACGGKGEQAAIPWTPDTGVAYADNTAPEAPAITLSPESPSTVDALFVEITAPATDADGDTLEYHFVWSRDGEARDDLVAETVGSVFTRRGETWSVAVLAHDGLASGTQVEASVTIGNSLPTLSSVAITPSELIETREAECVVGETDDADHDTVQVRPRWVLNGDELDREGPLTGDHFDKNDTIMCRVYLDDGVEQPPPIESETIIVDNTVPTVVGVSLSDFEPSTEDAVLAVPEGWYDEDGDAEDYIYNWYVNFVLVSTDPILDSVFTADHDNIYVELIPFDGDEQGIPVKSRYGIVLSEGSDTGVGSSVD